MTSVVEVAVFSNDVARSTAFYRELFGTPEAEWPGGAIFSAGSVKLFVHERAANLLDGLARARVDTLAA